MTAATENKLISRQEGCKQSYPSAASTHHYQGTAAFVTAAGYADDDTATGANKFAGIVIGECDNSSGSAGDLNVEVWAEGVFEVAGTFTQDDVGKPLYASDNFTFSTAYSAAAICIGLVREYVSSTLVRVDVEPDSQKDLLYAAVAASTAISNTTVQTAFDKAHTIKANTLRAGDVIRVRAQAIATATNSTDTLIMTLRLGTTDVLVTATVDVADGDIGFIDADIVIRTIGASGTFVAAGHTSLGVPGTVTAKPKLKASAAVDTTADLSVNVTATWSVASASNSCRLDIMDVELIRKK